MELTDWATTFSPNSQSSNHVKSEQNTPYFPDITDQLSHTPSVNGGTPSLSRQPLHLQNQENNLQLDDNHFSDQDRFFLQQFEQNLYNVNGNLAQPHPPAPERSNGPPGQFNELAMDTFDFILPDDLSFENANHGNGHSHHHSVINGDHASTAFPPSNLPHNTPSMLATKHTKITDTVDTSQVFASPILPGQNEKSFNNQHLYHKHNSSGGNTPVSSSLRIRSAESTIYHQPQSQNPRPENDFTPLVSPAVTPLDSQVNVNKQKPIAASFEPLTSPALTAQNDRRRSSSSMFGPSDDPNVNGTQTHKRRTPHSTPKLQAANSNSNFKKSPSVKSRNSSNKSTISPFEKLPESSLDDQIQESNETTPMLPPQGKKIDISNESNGGPATMMGFTMGRLAEQQQQLQQQQKSDDFGGRPKSTRSSRKSSTTSSKILPKSSSSSETTPVLTTQRTRSNSSSSVNNLGKKKMEKPAIKKASHKLAEQGRRNRMNVAVQELSNLIPQAYHDKVTIPSKATTVELASEYIRALLEEIEDLRN